MKRRATRLVFNSVVYSCIAFAFVVTLNWSALAGPADNSLVIGTSQEPRTLGGDFLNVISNQAIKTEVQHFLYPDILSVDLNSKDYAVLATEAPTVENKRVRFSDNGKGQRRVEIDFTLRSDIKWSDGKPITSDDVQFFYEVGKAKGMPVLNPDYWTRVGLKVKDKQSFTVSFEPAYYTDLQGGPNAPIGYRPAHIMRAAWEETKATAEKLDPAKDAEKLNELYRSFFQQFSSPEAVNKGAMVYSGPFMVKRWVPGNSIEMVRNKHFVLTPPGGSEKYLQKVVYRFIQNTNSLLVAILGGQIDVTSSVALTFDQARSPQLTSRAPGRYDIWFVPGAIWEHIDVNKFTSVQKVKDLQLDNPKTRQALLYAMNRDGLTKAFFEGLQPVANTWIAPVNPLFDPNVIKYSYNVEQSRKLFSELGWKPGKDGILERTISDGRTVRFEIEFVTTAGNAVRERAQQFLADNFKQVGISVKINNAPSAVVFADDFIQRGSEGKWTGMFMFAWTASLAEQGNLFACKDPVTLATFMPTKENNYQGQNVGGWCNEEFDKLRSQAVVEFDEKKRKEIFSKMQQLWGNQAPALPLYFRSNPFVVAKGLLNFVSSAYAGGFGYPSWQAWTLGWEQKGAKKLYDQALYAKK
jgi:peptide/nickel transport system substrate-binding protein